MCKKQILTAAISMAFTASAAGSLVEFQSGDVILASAMNGNFTYLEGLIQGSGERETGQTDSVDCTSEPGALAQYFSTAKDSDFLTVELSGECDWSGVNLNRSGVAIKNGSINGEIWIDSLQRVGFENVAVNGSIVYDGNSNGWLTNVSGNGASELTAHGSSRVWFGSGNSGFAEISIQDGSSLQSNDHLEANVVEAVGMSAIAVPQISADELFVESSSIGIWQDDSIIDSGKLSIGAAGIVLEGNAHLFVETDVTVTGHVSVALSSAMVVQGSVSANEVMVSDSSSLYVNGDIGASNIVEARSASSLVSDGEVSAPEVRVHKSSNLRADSVSASTSFAMQHSSSADVRTFDVGNFFCRTSSLYNDVSFTSATKDMWGFCYLEAAFDMNTMCGNVDESGSVIGFSTTDGSNFPGDCFIE